MADCDDLLRTLHAIVTVEDFGHGIVFPCALLREVNFAKKVARSVLSHLDRAVVEANRKTVLSVDLEVHAG